MINRPKVEEVMSAAQINAIKEGLRGDESVFFSDKLKELQETLNTMPVTYEQDGKGDEAVAYLHYFNGSWDWYITELDMEREQYQAFGLVKGFDVELGYVSLIELAVKGVELDMHWTPKTLREIKAE